MKKGQTSVRGGVQDLLCPFTKLNITQGANVGSHAGLEAIDTTSGVRGVKAPYFAPCDLKVVTIIKTSNTILWQSLKPVRLANGKVSNITIATAHDNTINFRVGYVIKQGVQMGNMGDAGIGTGVHAHIEQGYGHQTGLPSTGKYFTLGGKRYPVYGLRQQIPFEDAYFMDDTEILIGKAKWKYLKDVKVEESKPPVNPNKPDQILRKGDKFIFDAIYKVDDMKKIKGVWAVYDKRLGAYLNVKLVDVADSKGNKISRQVIRKGDFFVVPGTFTVEKTVKNDVFPVGWGFGVDAETLYEV